MLYLLGLWPAIPSVRHPVVKTAGQAEACTAVALPVDKKGEIDWMYMEIYIKALEKRIFHVFKPILELVEENKSALES